MTSSASDKTKADRLQEHSGPMIGIVSALHLEVVPFLDRCERVRTQSGNGFRFHACRLGEGRVCVVEGGTGSERARRATQALIDGFEPDWVLSVGFSGALTEQVKVGDLIVGESLTDSSGGTRLSIDVKMEADPPSGLFLGRLCTTGHIVRHVDEKKTLAEKTGAVAVDMESLAVAEACRERKTKFMAVRVISDDLSTDLPPEVLAILGPKGTVRAGALVGSLIKRPSSMKDLWALRENAVKASERLGQFLEGIVRRLAMGG